jgi:selenium-binding protein 1
MVSETWDGKRVYFTSSLLSKWDKKGADDEQFLRAYSWDGKKLARLFDLDFKKAELGRPHVMHFGQDAFYKNQIYTAAEARVAQAR